MVLEKKNNSEVTATWLCTVEEVTGRFDAKKSREGSVAMSSGRLFHFDTVLAREKKKKSFLTVLQLGLVQRKRL